MDRIDEIPACNKVKYLNTLATLERQQKVYHSVNLSILPDKGLKLKNQIDDLEATLKNLTIDNENTKKKSTCSYTTNENTQKQSTCSNTTNENVVSTKPQTDTSVKSKTYNIEGNSKHISNNKVPKDVPLTFADLKKYAPKDDFINNFVAGSPSFKNWRETDPKRTILTEAKPLLEVERKKPVLKGTVTLYSISNQVTEESVKKLHHSLTTYPEHANKNSEPQSLKTELLQHQIEGLSWMIWRESQQPSGGILADDMGLGKTLTMISLIVKQKELNNFCTASLDRTEDISRGTLIICPASILHQWKKEVDVHCEEGTLTVLLYHGNKRSKVVKDVQEFDIVLTTYNILLPEIKAIEIQKDKSPLFQLKWERIILDEAHTIKNHNSQTAQAVFKLKGFHKWAVTGTPIHNDFKDMYSLLKFLQLSPFDDYNTFKKMINDSSEACEKRRNMIVKSLLLRRTKDQSKNDGKRLVEMKNKTLKLYFIELSPDEQNLYDKLNEKVKEKLDKYFNKHQDISNVKNNLLVLLLRLQQCCNHASLLGKEAEDTVPDPLADISQSIASLSVSSDTCPKSTSTCSLDSSLSSLSFSEFEKTDLSDISFTSTKVNELLKNLEQISKNCESDKCVIVSQWVSMLDVVAHHLKESGKLYHKIAGDTKPEDRQKAAEDFNNNPDGPKILLLSLKAGGVGLNLIGANHLFLLDLHWNPALELQACDRIHRVGQKKDVFIHKFVCKNTIEEKILSLQTEKSNLAKNVLHGAKKVAKGLTMEDLKILFNIRVK